jgi:hypothetical protein
MDVMITDIISYSDNFHEMVLDYQKSRDLLQRREEYYEYKLIKTLFVLSANYPDEEGCESREVLLKFSSKKVNDFYKKAFSIDVRDWGKPTYSFSEALYDFREYYSIMVGTEEYFKLCDAKLKIKLMMQINPDFYNDQQKNQLFDDRRIKVTTLSKIAKWERSTVK